MINDFEIQNFRGFDKIRIRPLARVNLFAGRNSTGKTSLLEALFIYLGAHNPEMPMRVNSIRTGVVPSLFDETLPTLFHDLEQTEIRLRGRDTKRLLRTLTIRPASPERIERQGGSEEEPSQLGFTMTPGSLTTTLAARGLELEFREGRKVHRSEFFLAGDRANARTISKRGSDLELPLAILLTSRRGIGREDVERYSNLERRGDHGALVTTLQQVEPRLKRLTVLVGSGERPAIYGDIGLGELLPIQHLGEGLVRLLTIMVAVDAAEGGTVLVDEIENGFHHSALADVWRAVLVGARRSKVQVFATTHSRECIVAAHEAASESRTYSLGLHRLDRTPKGIEAVTYDKSSLGAALEADLEVR
jgi:hypothetical protein